MRIVRVALVAVALLALSGCNSLIDQSAVYTTTGSQKVTGTAPTRKGDPLVGVTVNGVAATLSGQQYQATIPLDGAAVFNAVLVVASYQSGYTQTDRSTVAYADGTHATVVGSGATVAAGDGVRLTSAGLSKMLPLAIALGWQNLSVSSSLAFPTSTTTCGPSCLMTLSQNLGPTVGDPGVPPSISLTSIDSTGVALVVTVPRVREYLSVSGPGISCTVTAMVDPVKYYAHFAATPVASGPDAGQVAVRPSGVGTTLPPVSASLNGCTTMSTAARADLSDKIVNVVGNLVNTMLNAPLITPTGSAPWPTPISAGLESALQALAAPAATPIDGLTLTPALTAAGLGSDGNGLLLATDSTSTASGVASGAPAQTSSLGFGNAAAAATGGTTPGSASYDLAAGTSLTALNQTLAAGTERGLFNQALTGNGDTGYTFNGLTGDLDLGPTLTTDRPVEVDLTPELAPSVTSAAGPSGSVGVVHVGGLRVSVAFSDTHTPLLTEVVDFDAPAQLGLYGHTMLLTATAPDAGAVHADVVTRATGVGTDAPALVLGWLGPHLVGPLGSGGVPVLTLPALPGVPTVSGWFVPTPAPTLNSVESDRVGDSLYLYLALS